VGGLKSWLWAFVGEDATYYTIEFSRGFDVAKALLGEDWDGVLGHDGWSPYDKFCDALHRKPPVEPGWSSALPRDHAVARPPCVRRDLDCPVWPGWWPGERISTMSAQEVIHGEDQAARRVVLQEAAGGLLP
jgi:hypothetical protein